jgi:RNA polymerase sigma factor (sigma-70 family)
MSPRISTRLLATQSDERLLALIRQGHERAFEALVHRYRRPLLSYCRRLGLPEARAEDVLQHALLKSWIALSEGVEVRQLKAWLYRIVHNTAVNALRDAAHDPDRVADPTQFAGAGESELDRGLATRQALAEVAALPPLQREVIVRTAVAGHSHDRVANDLGLTRGAVRGLAYRARATLRTAATALTPPWLIEWFVGGATQGAPAPERLAELAAGGSTVGIGGLLVKSGAVAVTAGALITGAVVQVHGLTHPGHRHPSRAFVALAPSDSASPSASNARGTNAGTARSAAAGIPTAGTPTAHGNPPGPMGSPPSGGGRRGGGRRGGGHGGGGRGGGRSTVRSLAVVGAPVTGRRGPSSAPRDRGEVREGSGGAPSAGAGEHRTTAQGEHTEGAAHDGSPAVGSSARLGSPDRGGRASWGRSEQGGESGSGDGSRRGDSSGQNDRSSPPGEPEGGQSGGAAPTADGGSGGGGEGSSGDGSRHESATRAGFTQGTGSNATGSSEVDPHRRAPQMAAKDRRAMADRRSLRRRRPPPTSEARSARATRHRWTRRRLSWVPSDYRDTRSIFSAISKPSPRGGTSCPAISPPATSHIGTLSAAGPTRFIALSTDRLGRPAIMRDQLLSTQFLRLA